MDDDDVYWRVPFPSKTNQQKLTEYKERRSARGGQITPSSQAAQEPFSAAKAYEKSPVGEIELAKIKAFFDRPKTPMDATEE